MRTANPVSTGAFLVTSLFVYIGKLLAKSRQRTRVIEAQSAVSLISGVLRAGLDDLWLK